MRPALANEPAAEPPAVEELLAAYAVHLTVTGRGHSGSDRGARAFLKRWPTPQDWADEPLAVRLEASAVTKAFVMFLIIDRRLRPGWDYLVERKLSSFWREIEGTWLEPDMARFVDAAEAVGFTHLAAFRAASQSIGRLLIQTGRPLDQLTVADLDELAEACRRRAATTGKGWRHYRAAINVAHRVLFHLDVTDAPPAHWQG
jgi:hypothetical protein